MNSSKSSERFASAWASACSSGSSLMANNSSRIVSRQLGSTPTSQAPSSIRGDKRSSICRRSRLAVGVSPLASALRPQHSGCPVSESSC
ncbi:MAG: hypothetical protein EBS75_03025 [Betaproteobacteria bacterium]|nr:hypothetical protein [Betaproteobacteria bacterium]